MNLPTVRERLPVRSMLDKDGKDGISEAEIRLFMKMFVPPPIQISRGYYIQSQGEHADKPCLIARFVSLERDAITTIFTSVESLLGKDLGGGLGHGRVEAFKAQIYAESERMMAARQAEIGRRAFAGADVDGSASIDFTEFCTWVRREKQLLLWIENLGKYWAMLASATERHTGTGPAAAG